jgi:hypothetical protein
MIRLRSRADTFKTEIEDLKIQSESDASTAGEILRAIADFRKDWTNLFAPMVSDAKASEAAAKKTRKTIEGQRDATLDRIEVLDQKLRASVAAFWTEFEAAARRRRELAEAEATARAKAEQAKEIAHHRELFEITGDAHHSRAAQQIAQTPIQPILVNEPESASLKIQGINLRPEVSIKITSLPKLIWAVYMKKVDINAILPNESWLRKEAVDRGVAFSVPGVERVVTNDLTVRSNR